MALCPHVESPDGTRQNLYIDGTAWYEGASEWKHFGGNLTVRSYHRHILHKLVQRQSMGFLHPLKHFGLKQDFRSETKTEQSCNKTLHMLHNSWYTDMVSFEQRPQFIQTGTCFLGHVRVIIVVSGSRLVELQQQTGKCEKQWQWARLSHLGCVLYV